MKRLLISVFLLLAILISTTAQDTQDITLRFAASVNDMPAMCGMTYDNVGSDEATISFNDFRLYISNIQLITADGKEVPLELEQDDMWQVENVALLDFEDGTGGCEEVGNAALNGLITGTAPENDYAGVKFELGVPFELNHEDVTLAPSPLNITGLWWNWQGGYKFIRVDVMTHQENEMTAWNIHIGSTACQSPASVIPPEELCAHPNITTIAFDDFDFENDVIVADLGGLLQNVPLYENTLMPPGCMSGADDPDCPALYNGFGLDFDTGFCIDDDCTNQTFFRVDDTIEPVDRTHGMDMNSDNDKQTDHSGHGN